MKECAFAAGLAPAARGHVALSIVVATDAPLLPGRLERLALARTGSCSGNYSGDIFLACSAAKAGATKQPVANVAMFSNELISPLFEGMSQATEKAILNAMAGAETMTGMGGVTAEALPRAGLLRDPRCRAPEVYLCRRAGDHG